MQQLSSRGAPGGEGGRGYAVALRRRAAGEGAQQEGGIEGLGEGRAEADKRQMGAGTEVLFQQRSPSLLAHTVRQSTGSRSVIQMGKLKQLST